MIVRRVACAFVVVVAIVTVGACGEPEAQAPKVDARPCEIVGHDPSDAALADVFARTQQPLVVAGTQVVACSCARRRVGGTTEGSKIGGTTEGSKIGGATEGTKIGGSLESSKIGGSQESSHIGGSTETGRIGGNTETGRIGGTTEGSKIGGSTEGSKIGGSTEGSKIGGSTEGSKIGGSTEGATVGGASAGFTCSEIASCEGYVFSGAASFAYDGKGRHDVVGSCIPAR